MISTNRDRGEPRGSLSSTSSIRFDNSGESGPPCGVPSSVVLTSPSASAPAVKKLRINTRARLSVRPRLATTPLRFANPSPPSGWIEDFHLQAVDHARHTTKKDRLAAVSLKSDQVL